ncbi:MAG: PAS domain-containing protein [Paracoccus sp. (in: a-proteobacteria)]|uniref:PAS domain-containing protein n=1 Tax=Paracoccus sp. TaxID=267 RepID=UPI0026DF8505|nr:PAS domain-containing protein [Paracoccus sp. (in: a-proteobacteria)]MDO5613968.1 PAS domain-containing protein [Paracoccus sp. (in: a-proteobacteria)]
MTDFNPEQPARILSDLRAYWQGLRKGRAVPLRSDVEPRGIHRALDHAFILERIAPGAARFRLAGRHLIDLMGMEVRGMPVCSLLNPASRGRLSDVLETVFKAPQIAELRLSGPADYGRPAISGRMLLLPLRSDLGDVTRALGCLISEGDIGLAPRRFDLVSEQVTPIIDGAEVMVPSPSARGFSDDAAPWRKPAIPTPNLPETPEERRARFRIIARED